MKKIILSGLLATVLSCSESVESLPTPYPDDYPAPGTLVIDSLCLKKVNPITGMACTEREELSNGYKNHYEVCDNIIRYNELTGLSGYSNETIYECRDDIWTATNYLILNRMVNVYYDEPNRPYIGYDDFVISLNLLNRKRTLCGETEFAKGSRGNEITDICGDGDGIEWNEQLVRAINNQRMECGSCRIQY